MWCSGPYQAHAETLCFVHAADESEGQLDVGIDVVVGLALEGGGRRGGGGGMMWEMRESKRKMIEAT